MKIDSTHKGNPENIEDPKVPRSHSRFPQSYDVFGTYRFGEITPFFGWHGVADDKVSDRASHVVRSYTLSSPLMQNVNLNKDYFAVPMEAILPNNWEKIFVNPISGSDFPKDANCCVLLHSFLRFFYFLKNAVEQSIEFDDANRLCSVMLKCLALTDLMYSDGSLLAQFNGHYSKYFSVPVTFTTRLESRTLDFAINDLYTRLVDVLASFDEFSIYHGGKSHRVVIDPNKVRGSISFRRLLEYSRDGSLVVSGLTQDFKDDVRTIVADFLRIGVSVPNQYHPEPSWREIYVNFTPLAAYQLTCAHYYTNDRIDPVYSANLYRQYMMDCFLSAADQNIPTLQVNGLTYTYDAFSGRVFGEILNTDIYDWTPEKYLFGLFSIRRSLRYVDYFTGSKTRPLAIGDTSILPDPMIDVVDVVKKISFQRFYNAVGRIGRKFSDYIKGIFDVEPAYDYHDPKWLASNSDTIVAVENSNTGNEQFELPSSVTSVLRSNDSRYAYTFYADRPCYVLGLQFFDIKRAYTQTIERNFFHTDRFDMFNPSLQFIGDQRVYRAEITSGEPDETFGYQGRYMEYKQRYDFAFGGMIHALRSWLFTDDFEHISQLSDHIGSDYIRSSNAEFDKFFSSLTGYSLSMYWHFIIKTTNDLDPLRPMAKDPQIL